MKTSISILSAVLGFAFAGLGELEITQIEPGRLVWTNSVTDATYEILQAPHLTSQWSVVSTVTNVLAEDIAQDADPLYYRLRWVDPPAITHTNLDTYVDMFSRTYLDLNGDEQWDVRLHQENVTLDINGADLIQSIYAAAHAISTAPFTAGQNIRMDLSPHLWVQGPQYQGVVLGTRVNRMDGPWDGPWQDVTSAFMPVQFLISNRIHLGWVKLSPSTNGDAWRVHSGAFRPAPETPLNAGECEHGVAPYRR